MIVSARTHRWDLVGFFPGRRRGSCVAIVLCRYCGTLAGANPGSSPLRPGACLGERPKPAPMRWAARRLEPTARLFWAIRGR